MAIQVRRTARELALLSLSQLSSSPEQLGTEALKGMVISAAQALASEARDILETAADELRRGNDRLLNSQIGASDLQSARAMVADAVGLTQTAINRIGEALELPTLIQLASQTETQNYAIALLRAISSHRRAIEQTLEEAMVNWQLSRLPRLDQDILRLAVGEILYLEVPEQVAINEAVELAKRYSDEPGRRLINGVLRRVSNRLKRSTVEAGHSHDQI